jgi:CheY-like chemotaxis protein
MRAASSTSASRRTWHRRCIADDVRDAVASAWRLERVVGDRAASITRHSLAEHRALLRVARGPCSGTRRSPSSPPSVFGRARGPARRRTRRRVPRRKAPLVLVVDDNDINRHVANEMLRRIGCRVLLADGGEAGVRLAAEHPFDLILMDVQMPVVDGFEAAARIRQQQAAGTRRTPIVAVTANAMRGDRQRCLDGGMDDYLAKPVTRAGLYELVQRWVPRAVVVPTPVRRTGGTPGAVRAQGAMDGSAPPVAVAPARPPSTPRPPSPRARWTCASCARSWVTTRRAWPSSSTMFVTLTAPMVDALGAGGDGRRRHRGPPSGAQAQGVVRECGGQGARGPRRARRAARRRTGTGARCAGAWASSGTRSIA